jgi:predicted nucleic acid-binding Zn ribbon protein
MDRRFLCQDCGAKWFIHGHRVAESDLTACGRCGGPLERIGDASGDDGYGSDPGEGGSEPCPDP